MQPDIPASKTKSRRWLYVELPLTSYQEAHSLQLKIVQARRNGKLQENVVLFLEHPAVFTLGRRGEREHFTVPPAFLQQAGIPVIQIERGGDVTYHGPGQLVAYPIIDLRALKMSVVDYVAALEEVMLTTVAEWGIKAERNDLNRGIWAGPCKLGSIGIAVRHGITFHGLALNINTALQPFTWIHPCGLQGIGMTSIAKETSQPVTTAEVCPLMKTAFEKVFGISLASYSMAELEEIWQET